MKNMKSRLLTCICSTLFLLPFDLMAKHLDRDRIVANPIDLNYRFRPEEKLPIRLLSYIKTSIICLHPSQKDIGVRPIW